MMIRQTLDFEHSQVVFGSWTKRSKEHKKDFVHLSTYRGHAQNLVHILPQVQS